MNTAERIAWGLLSLIVLIVWLHCLAALALHSPGSKKSGASPEEEDANPPPAKNHQERTPPVLKCRRANHRRLDLLGVRLVAHGVTTSVQRPLTSSAAALGKTVGDASHHGPGWQGAPERSGPRGL